jgi:hypothetical protein
MQLDIGENLNTRAKRYVKTRDKTTCKTISMFNALRNGMKTYKKLDG